MRKMRILAVVLGICALGSVITCSPFGGGDFACSGNASCNNLPGGVCEASGFCSAMDSTCPSGQRYSDGPSAGSCVTTGAPIDAPVSVVDSDPTIDSAVVIDAAPTIDASTRFCLGSYAHLCVPTIPTDTVPLPATLDTGTSTLCRADVTDMAGAPITTYCVVTGNTIAGSTVATGTRPLVLMSSGSIALATLDVASHRGGTTGAAANSSVCKPAAAGTLGGGGGGGGFGGKGGDGGNGVMNGGGGGATSASTTLRGGCPGGDGSTAGTHGNGGGVVLLMAVTSISITDAIDASGAGGNPATNGTNGGGASGGGSGGMIIIEAPTIANPTGIVYANGGSGAEGNGAGGTQGQVGADPASVAAATGGNGLSGTGGNGGNGGAKAANGDGGKGGDGTATQPPPPITKGGGGGGGGAAGVILTHGGALTANNVSPTPTVIP